MNIGLLRNGMLLASLLLEMPDLDLPTVGDSFNECTGIYLQISFTAISTLH